MGFLDFFTDITSNITTFLVQYIVHYWYIWAALAFIGWWAYKKYW